MLLAHITYFLLISTVLATEDVAIVPCGVLAEDVPYASAVAYDGVDSAYFFGGEHAGYSNSTIIKVGLNNVSSAEVVAHFPYPRRRGVVVPNENGDIYYIGGYNHIFDTDSYTSIYKYTPGSPAAVFVNDLTVWRDGHSAVRVGDGIYIFGGDVCDIVYSAVKHCEITTIELFNLTANTMEIIGQMPDPELHGTAAAYDGQYIYLFGGSSPDYSNYETDQILRFDPRTYHLEVLDDKLFARTTLTNAVIIDKLAYIVPGDRWSHHNVMLYEVDTGRSSEVAFELFFSDRPFNTAYAFNQSKIYMFGAKVLYEEHNVMCIEVSQH